MQLLWLASDTFTTVGLGAGGTGTIASGSVSYTAVGAVGGEDIGIRFLAPSGVSLGRAAMDNISLNAVPEPASAAVLLGMTGLSLLHCAADSSEFSLSFINAPCELARRAFFFVCVASVLHAPRCWRLVGRFFPLHGIWYGSRRGQIVQLVC